MLTLLLLLLPTTIATDSALYTVEGLAQYLEVPVQTVYRWNCNGTGPRAIKVGRFVRYRRADVERWLDEHAATSGS
jgi:excisionase family DNA binding protein